MDTRALLAVPQGQTAGDAAPVREQGDAGAAGAFLQWREEARRACTPVPAGPLPCA